jgi:hypothetical protein
MAEAEVAAVSWFGAEEDLGGAWVEVGLEATATAEGWVLATVAMVGLGAVVADLMGRGVGGGGVGGGWGVGGGGWGVGGGGKSTSHNTRQ